jgi:tetratricopeptide (TPR) repeat protein
LEPGSGHLMEKSWRLQRYSRKDYTDLVEFPVEIVGRDGVVRRYTYEDSIRLYRRRITFAPVRYRDPELVSAEVEHCRSRIDQLRRSYFYRYGWGTPEGQPQPVEVFGAMAGEIAAFVCRVLKVDGRPEVRLEPVSGTRVAEGGVESVGADRGHPALDDVSTWYMAPKDGPAGMLMYVHRFDGANADEVRDRFFGLLKQLERAARYDGDVERLVAFHHTVDCGFVLTARGDDVEALTARAEEEPEEPPTQEVGPWEEALDVIRRGGYAEGLGRCRQLVAEQPWHRNAYVAGAVVAVHVEQPLVAEDFALIGSRYFPQDAALLYYLGLSRSRQGRSTDAVEPLRQAVGLGPEMAVARLLLAVVLLQTGRVSEARATLRARAGVESDDRRADASMERLDQWLFWRAIMVGAGYVAAGIGLLATALAGWFGLVPVGLGLAMAGAGLFAFRREVDRIAGWHRFDDVTQGLKRLRRASPGEGPAVS